MIVIICLTTLIALICISYRIGHKKGVILGGKSVLMTLVEEEYIDIYDVDYFLNSQMKKLSESL